MPNSSSLQKEEKDDHRYVLYRTKHFFVSPVSKHAYVEHFLITPERVRQAGMFSETTLEELENVQEKVIRTLAIVYSVPTFFFCHSSVPRNKNTGCVRNVHIHCIPLGMYPQTLVLIHLLAQFSSRYYVESLAKLRKLDEKGNTYLFVQSLSGDKCVIPISSKAISLKNVFRFIAIVSRHKTDRKPEKFKKTLEKLKREFKNG